MSVSVTKKHIIHKCYFCRIFHYVVLSWVTSMCACMHIFDASGFGERSRQGVREENSGERMVEKKRCYAGARLCAYSQFVMR